MPILLLPILLLPILLLTTGADSFYVVIQCQDLREDAGCSRVDALASTTNSAIASQLQVFSHRQPVIHESPLVTDHYCHPDASGKDQQCYSASSLAFAWSSRLKSTSGIGVEIEKDPRCEEPSRQCFFVELDKEPHPWADWKLDCPSKFLVKRGSYNVSIHLNPSGYALKSSVFITGKIGDENHVYTDAPAYWATDIAAHYNACSTEMTITFELAKPHYNFSKYAVYIMSMMGPVHSTVLQVDRSKSHVSHVFPNVHPGRYNISVAPVETSRGNIASCVCRCTDRRQCGCAVPGCATSCVVSKSSFVYADVDDCVDKEESLNSTALLPIVFGCLAAVVLLCCLVFVGLTYKKPGFDTCWRTPGFKIISTPSTKRHPQVELKKQVTLTYWESQNTSTQMMKHLENLLRKYCNCDVILEHPFRDFPDQVRPLLSFSNNLTILMLSDFNSDAQTRLMSDDCVILARLRCTSCPLAYVPHRRMFTLPDELDSLCRRLHGDILPSTFDPAFMFDPDDGIPLCELMDNASRSHIDIVNQNFDELQSECTTQSPSQRTDV
ncbi:hypothetical protein CAPTEDRAFT_202278 [Capitella teleta]|uniref:ILCR1 Ig-like domain-containing protein n=1 Tax=Capitella teleta TaxID=283909 RepID=R7TFT9_CAPTE|nr:hypothetical protein CAPTEDRAFT_202278 [Capitella teleta]|eukprot:ELT90401.1 hypothetical protein CAPTEDRAFT_202278 [Capitella teleta]